MHAVWLAESVPGVKVIFDTSHAQLYLNVRRGVREEVPGQNLEPLRRFIAEAHKVFPMEHSRWRIAAHIDQVVQVWQCFGPQLYWFADIHFRADSPNRVNVVDIAKTIDKHKRLTFRLTEHIFQLEVTIGWVDIHEQGTDFSCRELINDPFSDVS